MSSQLMLIDDKGNLNPDRNGFWWRCGVLTIALFSILIGGASAQDWLKYHKDVANTGATDAATNPGIDDGSDATTGLQPGWTYPWPARSDTSDSQTTLDDKESNAAAGTFTSQTTWVDSDTIVAPEVRAQDGFDKHYWYSQVLTPASGKTEADAKFAMWTFGTNITVNWYRIEVFFPSGSEKFTRTVDGNTQLYTPGNTEHAKYYVTDANGAVQTVTISQSNGGGWTPLGSARYWMGPGSTIRLSNWSSDGAPTSLPGSIPSVPDTGYTDEGRLVKADAIRLVRDYGSVYSSPAVYKPDLNNVGADRAVVFGQVLADPFSRKTAVEINWGKITAIDAVAGPGRSGNPNNTVFNAPMWEYPKSNMRAPNEGPIAGGVYSSPVVDSGIVFVGADDGQIYALDQNDGRLMWNGPGATVDNDFGTPAFTTSGFTQVMRVGDDFFGQSYYTADAKPGGGGKCDYTVAGLKNYYYQVYAWIPGMDGDKEWAQNVKYVVDPGGISPVTTLVNQSSCASQGELQGPRWVKIGDPVLVKSGTVKVSVYEDASGSPCGSGKTLSVVADAIRVIPENIAAFGYCSPSVVGGRVYSSNSGGRIIALDKLTGSLAWIWPKTRQDSTDFDDIGLGAMAASVAITPGGDELFYASVTGRVGKLKGIGGAIPTDDSSFSITSPDGTPITIDGMTSSPMLDGSFVYWATIGGKIYKTSQSKGASDWVFPDDFLQDDEPFGAPVGAFRYSTPAKGTVAGRSCIVAGSADGNVYEIPIDKTNTNVGVYSSSGPVYSSVATAPANGASLPSVAFFGTETSVFQGISLDVSAKEFTDPTGTSTEPQAPVEWGWSTNGQTVFSSPAIAKGLAKNWIYVGGDDGRLYAFTMQNGGGSGVEGSWPSGDNDVAPEPPGVRRDSTKNRGSIYFDMDIVTEQDFNDPASYFAKIGLDPNASSSGRHPNGDPFGGANPVRLEWGDTIRVLAWSFLGNNGQVNVELQNRGSGGSAGALETLSQVANDVWPPSSEPDLTIAGVTGRYYFAKITWSLDSTKLLTPGTGYAIKGFITGGANNQPLEAFVPAGNLASTDKKRRNNTPRDFVINHPMAIAFNQDSIASGGRSEGWTAAPPFIRQGFTSSRTDSGIDYNGSRLNTWANPPSDASFADLAFGPPAKHGGNSNPLSIFLADRSVLGITRNNPQSWIRTLRASRGELRFLSSPINMLPWETVANANQVNTSVDYPDISSRRMLMDKRIDGADPTRGNAGLIPSPDDMGPATPPASPSMPKSWQAVADPLMLTVEVPKYQPPNNIGSPYRSNIRIWIDANGDNKNRTVNGQLDNADTVTTGRPLTASEAYREFRYGMNVGVDPTMYAEQTVIDVGKRPIGFGIAPELLTSFPYLGFLPYSGTAFVPTVPADEFFQKIIVRNDGNINLLNLRVLKDVFMFSDQVQTLDFNNDRYPDAGFALSGANIISSLDSRTPGGANMDALPISGYMSGFGHVLHKSLVGEISPTTLTVPDKKQAAWFNLSNAPTEPMVSVRIPIGVPVGTYSAVVPVFADQGILLGTGGVNNGVLDAGEAFTTPAMTLKVTVREGKLTDLATAGSLPNVDSLPVNAPRWGDAQPAALRMFTRSSSGDIASGDLNLFWTSNRSGTNDPRDAQRWSLFQSSLGCDSSGQFVFQGASPDARWWSAVEPLLPLAGLPNLTNLFPGMPDGLDGVIVPKSDKFTSPSVGQDQDSGEAWLTFTGQVDKKVGFNAPATEYRIFYAKINANGQVGTIRSVPRQDYTAPKFSPRIVQVAGSSGTSKLYLFWYSGAGSRFKLFYNYNNQAGDPASWSDDTALTIPMAVTTAAEPVPVVRFIPPLTPGDPPDSVAHFDVVYSAITKFSGNADLLLSRYRSSSPGLNQRLNLQRLPRVYGEVLQRDTRSVSLYGSRHLGWVRPNNGQNPPSNLQSVSGLDRPLPNVNTGNEYALPMIWVQHFDPVAKTYGTFWVNNTKAQVDAGSGLVFYDNSQSSDPVIKSTFGRVVVDVSNGTVKFDQPLSGKDKVIVDYTPQTWRLTVGTQPDTSPYALIEKTLQVTRASAGLRRQRDPSIYPTGFQDNLPIDRMWLFWRQGPGAVHANTLYYKTLRLGVVLKHPIALQPNGVPVNLVITTPSGTYSGPYQLDIANNRILFPDTMENTPVWIGYTGTDTISYVEPEGFGGASPIHQKLSWISEIVGGDDRGTVVPVDSMVNEGQVFAFLDPDCLRAPEDPQYKTSLIWLFWASSRAGSSDIFYETISPPLRPNTITAVSP